jgi:hypothetical protein
MGYLRKRLSLIEWVDKKKFKPNFVQRLIQDRKKYKVWIGSTSYQFTRAEIDRWLLMGHVFEIEGEEEAALCKFAFYILLPCSILTFYCIRNRKTTLIPLALLFPSFFFF